MNPIFLYLSVFFGILSAYVVVYYFLRRQLRIRLLVEIDRAVNDAVDRSVGEAMEKHLGPKEIPFHSDFPEPKEAETPPKKRRKASPKRGRFVGFDFQEVGDVPRVGRKVSAKDILSELSDGD